MAILAESAIFAVIPIYPTWRIFGRAGFHPALSLLLFVPAVGWLIVLFVLGFVAWPATKRRIDAAGGGGCIMVYALSSLLPLVIIGLAL